MKINRETLLKILEAVRPGLAAKELIEQSTSFIFLEGIVAACNDRVCVTHPIESDLSGTVRAEELYSLLKRMRKEEVELTATDSELLVKCGRSDAGITLQKKVGEAITKTIDEATKAKKVWKTLPVNFVQAMNLCAMSASRDMTRPELTAIHLKDKYAESCDNFRLTRYELDSPFSDELLIPAQAINELFPNPLKYAANFGWIHFSNKEGAVFSCRILQGKSYNDLGPILAVTGEKIVFPKGLTPSLERAMVFAGKGFETSLFQVTISVKEGLLKVEGKGEAGWIREKMKCEYQGKPVQFKINPPLLIDILGHLQEAQVTAKMLKFKGKGFVHCCSTFQGKTTEVVG